MRARQMVNDLLNGFFSGGSPDRGTCPRPQTFGHFDTELNAIFRFGLLERLRIGVRHDEVNTVQLFFDHVVDRVTTCTTNTENGDTGFKVFLTGHRKVECHVLSAC